MPTANQHSKWNWQLGTQTTRTKWKRTRGKKKTEQGSQAKVGFRQQFQGFTALGVHLAGDPSIKTPEGTTQVAIEGQELLGGFAGFVVISPRLGQVPPAGCCIALSQHRTNGRRVESTLALSQNAVLG